MSYIYLYILNTFGPKHFGILKSDKCLVIHAKCTILTIVTNPWHEQFSSYQFMGFGLTQEDTYTKTHK